MFKDNLRFGELVAAIVLILGAARAEAQPALDGYVFRTGGGSVNGYAIDATHHEVTVAPGEAITGSIAVEATNLWPGNVVAPLGGTVTWGDRETQPWLAIGSILPGTHTFNVAVDKTAPATPGDYHIVVAFRGEFTIEQVMSLTNWTTPGNPIWYDGNDAGFDWTPEQFQQAYNQGAVLTNVLAPEGRYDAWLPATAVTVHVQRYDGFVFRAPGGSLNGVSIDRDHFDITVNPGEAIIGTVVVEATNLWSPHSVTPLGGTATWGDRTSQPWLTHGWIPTGTHTFNVAINKTAPNAPGDYHIVIAFGAEFTIQQVVSRTNWSTPGNPIWNDGNDVGFDWEMVQFDQIEQRGAAACETLFPGNVYHTSWLPATSVVVHVESEAGPCPSPGSCMEPHPSPGCSEANCCELICSLDPLCCEVEWDANCVAAALVLCAPDCDGNGAPDHQQPDCDHDGTPDVCELHPRFFDDFSTMNAQAWAHHGTSAVNIGGTIPGAVYVHGAVDSSPPARITHAMLTGAGDFEARFDIRRSAYSGSGSVWIGWVNVDDYAAVRTDYSWETHDSLGNPASGLFVQLNSGSGAGGAPHRSHMTVSTDGAITAVAAFDPGPMGDNVWHTLKFGRMGTEGYVELRNRATNALVASTVVSFDDVRNYGYFHISSIDGQSNNWWIDVEIDNLTLTASDSADCDGNGVPDECQQDCDHDGTPDVCELPPIGTGDDCNANGIPDECDGFVCDDGNPCTDDTCAGTVCVFTPNANPCDDGSACTVGDTCSGGTCTPGAPRDCGDGVACTRDVCDPASGACISTPDDSLCDDGRYCTGIERCDQFLGCQAGSPPDCDDGVTCTIDFCDETSDDCEHDLQDADGDGFCDDDDACPHSDRTPTVVIGGCSTGVGNRLLSDGCTMSDEIAECAAGARNHGAFVSCVAQVTNEWKRAGLITGAEKGRIQSCAARADVPRR